MKRNCFSSYKVVSLRDHPFSTYAKFSEKLTFLTPWYWYVRVCIRGLEMLVFRKHLRTYLMNGPLLNITAELIVEKLISSKVLWPITVVHSNLLTVSIEFVPRKIFRLSLSKNYESDPRKFEFQLNWRHDNFKRCFVVSVFRCLAVIHMFLKYEINRWL